MLIRTISLFCFSVFLFSSLPGAAFAETTEWNTTLQQVNALQSKAATESQKTQDLLKQDRAKLLAQVKQLRDQLEAQKKAVTEAKERYALLLEKEQQLKEIQKDKQEEIKTFEGTIRTAATQMKELSSTSFLSPFMPEREALFQTLLTPDRMPGTAELQALIETSFAELVATATVTTHQKEIIDAKGNLVTAKVIRSGTASALYQIPSGEVGFLSLADEGRALKSINNLSSGLTKQIDSAFESASIIPLDFSHGAAFIRFSAEKDVWQRITDGGLLVWPILGIGVLALLLGLERLIMMLRLKHYPANKVTQTLEAAKKGNWDACRELLTQTQTPTSRVMLTMLSKASASNVALEKSMEEAIMTELPRMERFLPTLQILAAVAPLLGLLGTVTGMINTFQVITLFGTGDPHMLSGGISEALVTTQLGLAVAIPIMMLHHILNSRVDRLVGEMEEKGTALIATIASRT